MTLAQAPVTRPPDCPRRAPRPGEIVVLLVVLLPLVFIGWAWQHSGGLPYFEDNNESSLSYVQGRNLQRFRLDQTSALSFDGAGPVSDGPTLIYTHNPNVPRYLNWLLLLVGVESLPLQILILSVVGTLAALLLLWVLLANMVPAAPSAALVLLAALALDSMGFLSWAVNTYRVLAFVLLWGVLAAIVRPRTAWAPVVAGFFLFQYEYGFAVFAGTAAAVFAVLRDGRGAFARLVWLALGATLALGLFAVQVLTYLGPAGASSEVLQTLARRGATIELSAALVQIGPAVIQRYGWPIPLLAAWALINSPLVLVPSIRRAASSGTILGRLRLGLGQLQLSLGLGGLMTALLLRNFFVDAYVLHFLPCLVFPLVVGVATTATDVVLIGGAVTRRLGITIDGVSIGPSLAAVLAAGMMLTNFGRIFELYPPVSGEMARLLATKYRGLPFVGLAYRDSIAFALTGAPAGRVSEIATDADLERVASLRTPDGQLYYLCIDPWQRGPVCDYADYWYTTLGHTVADRGKEWSIIRIEAQNRPGPRP